MNNKISQLVDEELNYSDYFSILDQLKNDSESQKTWQRFHLIGHVLRGEVAQVGGDLSKRIEDALDKEPTVIAPQIAAQHKTANKVKNPGDFWKPVSLLAIAASLVIVAVVTLNPVQTPDRDNNVASNRLLSEQESMLVQEFTQMLAEHSEFTSPSGLNGLIVYAKLVSSQPLDR